jgi:hypothetical protein
VLQDALIIAPEHSTNYPTPRRRLQFQRGTLKTVFQDGTATFCTSPRHVTGVNNERDAESIFAVSVTLGLTLRQVKNPLSFYLMRIAELVNRMFSYMVRA